MSKPSVKKTAPTVHATRPTVHPYGTNIDFVPMKSYRVTERDRGPQWVQDMREARARVKRAGRRAKRVREGA